MNIRWMSRLRAFVRAKSLAAATVVLLVAGSPVRIDGSCADIYYGCPDCEIDWFDSWIGYDFDCYQFGMFCYIDRYHVIGLTEDPEPQCLWLCGYYYNEWCDY